MKPKLDEMLKQANQVHRTWKVKPESREETSCAACARSIGPAALTTCQHSPPRELLDRILDRVA